VFRAARVSLAGPLRSARHPDEPIGIGRARKRYPFASPLTPSLVRVSFESCRHTSSVKPSPSWVLS
jgi:hypothetical protein